MGSFPNIFGGSSSSSGVSDQAISQTVNDAIAGANMMGDTQGAALLGGDSGGFNPFSTLSNISNSLSSSGAAPPAVSPQTPVDPQSDPSGAAGGTQSNVQPGQGSALPTLTPGETGPQSPRQTTPTIYQQDSELNKLIRMITGQPKGPTWILPQVKPGETGPQAQQAVPGQTPAQILNSIFGSQPTDASIPPGAPQGGDISVHKPNYLDPTIRAQGPGAGAGVAAPQPQPYLPENDPIATGPGSSPVPQQPPQTQPPQDQQQPPIAQAQPRQMSRLMQDIAGISHGNPASLLDLAQALYPIIPALGIAATGKGRPGVNYAGPGELEQFFGEDEAAGLNDAMRLGLQDKNGKPSRTGAYDRNGAYVATPEKTAVSNQIPGLTPKVFDDYVRQAAPKRHIDPDIASKVFGSESNYGQNNINRRDVNGYPDYGPAQLNMAPGALGDQYFKETKLNPQNFAQDWKRQIDYALDHIAKEGWTDLYPGTSKKLGLSRWSGINRPAPAVSMSLSGTSPAASFLT